MIRENSRVLLRMTLRADGELVHETPPESPLDYVVGSGGLAAGFENALLGMKPGETKKTVVPPQDAFGFRDPDNLRNVPKEAFVNLDSLEVGDAVRGTLQNRPFTAYVQAIEKDEVKLDLNHPLAGKTIDFEVEVLEVK